MGFRRRKRWGNFWQIFGNILNFCAVNDQIHGNIRRNQGGRDVDTHFGRVGCIHRGAHHQRALPCIVGIQGIVLLALIVHRHIECPVQDKPTGCSADQAERWNLCDFGPTNSNWWGPTAKQELSSITKWKSLKIINIFCINYCFWHINKIRISG